jgi:flagellar motility protein MotE (MotC chaperone)
MNNNIKCPNCGEIFDVENVLSAELEKKIQQEYQEKLNLSLAKIEDDKKRLEEEQKDFEEKKKKKTKFLQKD